MVVKVQKIVENLFRNKPLMIALAGIGSVLLLSLPSLLGTVGDLGDGAALGVLKENAWSTFLGVFHPVVLHLPIGALILVFSIELLNLITKEYKFNMTVPLLFNAFCSVIAAILGILWYFGGEYSQSSELLDSHMWKGLIYAVCAIWLPLMYQSFQGGVKVLVYYVTLTGSVAMMAVAAHDGGESKHGDLFEKAPWNLEQKRKEKEKQKELDKEADPEIYAEIVTPILAQKCYACHHSTKKVKNGLKMDTFADLMQGGDYQEDDPTLTPGDVENSFLITTIELPEDDDLHMPPKKKSQVTADELAILKWWVEIGAPDAKKLSEVEVPKNIEDILGTEKEAVELASKQEEPGREKNKVTPVNSPLVAEVATFLQAYPNALSWTSLSDSTLYFSAASQRNTYTDADLASLEPFVNELDELNLSDTSVGDSAAQLINKCNKLRVLKLANTKISDSLLKEIEGNPTIEILVLHSTEVSDQSVMLLADMAKLKKVFLWNTKVTEDGVRQLKEVKPGLEINYGL